MPENNTECNLAVRQKVWYNKMVFDANQLDYKALNEAIRQSEREVTITGCCGQRFLAAGMKEHHITIDGIPGNALGAYLDGASIVVHGNAQDAVGDTMNSGSIIIHGNIGDAAGYAMRGGKLYIQGNAGYRAGIHMKEYKEQVPVMMIGGCAGSFLGEYQAGGIIVVLGLNASQNRMIGNFPCTGMHGGKIYLRGRAENIAFPPNVHVQTATEANLDLIEKYVTEFCTVFGYDFHQVWDSCFTVITPDSKNPYKQMYVAN